MASLLEPLVLGDRTAPNRILFGPHETNLAWGRRLSDRHRAYYQERAAGGCGTVVVEEASVHPTSWPYERAPAAAEAAEGWASIAEACHQHGTLVVAALGHAGGQGSSAFSQRELWAPSDEPEVNSREVPKIMEPEDIAEVVAGFESAARTAAAAGCDGVEINAGQHSLVRQFLSGLTNRRDDEHGADRTLFARRVLGAARTGLGSSGVLGLRLSCDELAPWAGLTPESALEVARELAPLVDYLVVVRGSIFSVAETRPTGHHGPNINLDLARLIRQGLDTATPVIAQGSIVDAHQAEEAVANGDCDGVEMTRAFIAEPRLVARLVAGRRPRPCLLCNQRCQVRDNRNPIVTCVVEPRAGHETIDEPEDGTTPFPREVLVVGAGPAGLEAARVAAARGHQVTLVEGTAETGGRLRQVAVMPGFHRFADLADWLAAEVEEAGAVMKLGRLVDADLLAGWNGPVIMASGGRPSPPAYPVEPGVVVVEPGSVLDDHRPPPGPGEAGSEPVTTPTSVVVWDPIGDGVGVGVAELLAAEGRAVVFCTPDPVAGTQLALTGDLAGANVRLQQAGVRIERRQRLVVAGPHGVTLEHTMTGDTVEVAAEMVVDCSHRLPRAQDPGPGDVGTSRPPHQAVIRVGDAVAPRTVAEAIREGRAAALDLDRLPRPPGAGSDPGKEG